MILSALLTGCVQTAGVRFSPELSAERSGRPRSYRPAAVPTDAPAQSTEQAEGTQELEPARELERHTIFMTMAVVTEGRQEGGAAIGLEYEFRVDERLGFAVFGEYVAGQLDVGVFGLLAYWHPTERLALGIGPGFEVDRNETSALGRFGGLYEFHAGEIVVAPAAYVDWISGGTFAAIVGLNFGKKF